MILETNRERALVFLGYKADHYVPGIAASDYPKLKAIEQALNEAEARGMRKAAEMVKAMGVSEGCEPGAGCYAELEYRILAAIPNVSDANVSQTGGEVKTSPTGSDQGS